jgi:hypothetical protein
MEKLAERKKPLTPEPLNMEFYSTFFFPSCVSFCKKIAKERALQYEKLAMILKIHAQMIRTHQN